MENLGNKNEGLMITPRLTIILMIQIRINAENYKSTLQERYTKIIKQYKISNTLFIIKNPKTWEHQYPVDIKR